MNYKGIIYMFNKLTDRNLLKYIYKKYYKKFIAFDKSNPSRANKYYVPIDCEKTARKFGVDVDIIYGRLLHHLDKKYGYKDDKGNNVHLFAASVGTDFNAVNMPLLHAALAEMEENHFRFMLPIILSFSAIIISLLSHIDNDNHEVKQERLNSVKCEVKIKQPDILTQDIKPKNQTR